MVPSKELETSSSFWQTQAQSDAKYILIEWMNELKVMKLCQCTSLTFVLTVWKINVGLYKVAYFFASVLDDHDSDLPDTSFPKVNRKINHF